jgi:hypothetical protein
LTACRVLQEYNVAESPSVKRLEIRNTGQLTQVCLYPSLSHQVWCVSH